MRNYSYLIFLCLITLGIASCSKTDFNKKRKITDLELLYLKGNVASYSDTTWEAKEMFGEVQKINIREIEKVEFNEKGGIAAITYYRKDGSIRGKQVKTWTSDHFLDVVTLYSRDGNPISKYVFKNDGNKITGYTTYHYSSPEYKSHRYTKPKEIPKGDISFEYDKEDRLVKETYICDGDTSYMTRTYIDANNNYVSKYIVNDSIEKIDTIYHNKGERLFHEIEEELLCTISYNSDCNSENIKYKYDNNGNWIERVERIDFKNDFQDVWHVNTRHIEYR